MNLGRGPEILGSRHQPRHLRNFAVLLVSFAGSVYAAHLFYNADQQFFLGVLAGIFSPAIIIAVYKLF